MEDIKRGLKTVKLRKNERTALQRLVRSPSGQAALARRANMIPMSVSGVAFYEIPRLRCNVRFIQRWRERFIADRAAGAKL